MPATKKSSQPKQKSAIVLKRNLAPPKDEDSESVDLSEPEDLVRRPAVVVRCPTTFERQVPELSPAEYEAILSILNK